MALETLCQKWFSLLDEWLFYGAKYELSSDEYLRFARNFH